MFAYCLNNPVLHIDVQGLRPIKLSKINEVALDGTNGESDGSNTSDSNPKDTPPDHPNYKPPKKGPGKVKNPNGKGWGWVDDKGNVWVWTPNMHGGPGWTVQEPDGGHSHAYPGGGVRLHCEAKLGHGLLEIFPAEQNTAQIFSTPSSSFIGGCALMIAVVAFGVIEFSMGGLA